MVNIAGGLEMWNHVQPNLNFFFAPEDVPLNQQGHLLDIDHQ